MEESPLVARIKAARLSFVVVLGVSCFLLLTGVQPVVDFPDQWQELRRVHDQTAQDFLKERADELETLRDEPGYEEARRAIEDSARLAAAVAMVDAADRLDVRREDELVSLFGYSSSRRQVRFFGPVVLLACMLVLSVHTAALRRELEASDPEVARKALASMPWVLTSEMNRWQWAGICLLAFIPPGAVLLVRAMSHLDLVFSSIAFALTIILNAEICRSVWHIRRVGPPIAEGPRHLPPTLPEPAEPESAPPPPLSQSPTPESGSQTPNS